MNLNFSAKKGPFEFLDKKSILTQCAKASRFFWNKSAFTMHMWKSESVCSSCYSLLIYFSRAVGLLDANLNETKEGPHTIYISAEILVKNSSECSIYEGS